MFNLKIITAAQPKQNQKQKKISNQYLPVNSANILNKLDIPTNKTFSNKYN